LPWEKQAVTPALGNRSDNLPVVFALDQVVESPITAELLILAERLQTVGLHTRLARLRHQRSFQRYILQQTY